MEKKGECSELNSPVRHKAPERKPNDLHISNKLSTYRLPEEGYAPAGEVAKGETRDRHKNHGAI